MSRPILLRSTAVIVTGAVIAFGFAACNKAPTATQGSASSEATADGAVEYVSDTPPPALPVYSQPPLPEDGYIWTPGYWAWDDGAGDYFWTPGTWVEPPQAGLLWTPGYWAFRNGRYAFSRGYWGSRVGFYGGVDYGYGYDGSGYQGGRWQGDSFYYNATVNNVANAPIQHMYRRPVLESRALNPVSFNGGDGGVTARATPDELAAARAPHVAPIEAQNQHVRRAQTNPGLRASVNHGRPTIAATSRPAVFDGRGVVTDARAPRPYRPPAVGAMAAPQGRSASEAERPAQSRPEPQPMSPAARPIQSAPTARATPQPTPSSVQARPAARPAPTRPTTAPGPGPR